MYKIASKINQIWVEIISKLVQIGSKWLVHNLNKSSEKHWIWWNNSKIYSSVCDFKVWKSWLEMLTKDCPTNDPSCCGWNIESLMYFETCYHSHLCNVRAQLHWVVQSFSIIDDSTKRYSNKAKRVKLCNPITFLILFYASN